MDRDYIDIYCERTGPGLWAEPFNAVTNLAFIVAAALLVRALLRTDDGRTRDPALWTLVALVFLIGLGSGLFHTLAVRWAMLADVIPIAVFILAYTGLALRRFVRLSWRASLLGIAAMLALTLAMRAVDGVPGAFYLPALAVMVGLGLFLRARRHATDGNALLLAGCIFAVSFGFRTLDGPVCMGLPVGTHFLWHLLNAIVLYIVNRAMIRSPASAHR